MTLPMLLREAWISTYTRIVPALMVAVICASMCATTLLTVGRTAAAETEVLSRLEGAGSRELILGDRFDSRLFSAAVVDSIAGLSTVERAVGVTIALDARSGHLTDGGPQVPAWGVVGDIDAVASIVNGRAPNVSEALVSTDAMNRLGLDAAVGYVVRGDHEYAIVGTFAAKEPFSTFNSGVIYRAEPHESVRNLHVIAVSASQVTETQQLVLNVVAAPRSEDITVQSPASLAELQGEIAGDLGHFGRQLLFLVLGAGALLTAVVVLADVLVRRADLGRRRALGSTRRALITIVLLRVLIASLAGVAVGALLALWALGQWDVRVPLDFVVGTALLTLVASAAAGSVPALLAANQDPVGVLRTP